jgi:hypothetical protein
MKWSKFTTREGLVMLLGVALVLIMMLWLILSGIVQVNHCSQLRESVEHSGVLFAEDKDRFRFLRGTLT